MNLPGNDNTSGVSVPPPPAPVTVVSLVMLGCAQRVPPQPHFGFQRPGCPLPHFQRGLVPDPGAREVPGGDTVQGTPGMVALSSRREMGTAEVRGGPCSATSAAPRYPLVPSAQKNSGSVIN